MEKEDTSSSTSSGPGGDTYPVPDGDDLRSGVLEEPRVSSTTTSTTNRNQGVFVLSVTGRIESAEIFGLNEIYCKYSLVYGEDWELSAGLEEGVSQIAEKDSNGSFVWNFPLQMTFKSSNPHGWPQLVISVYGADFLGNHVARGYGSTHIPLSQGSFTKILPLFVPESSSFLQRISSWLLGRRPEFVDPKIVAQNDGRQLVRVNSSGHVRTKFEVILKELSKLGYVSSANLYEV